MKERVIFTGKAMMDESYAAGAKAEREAILAMLNDAINYESTLPPSVRVPTGLLELARNEIVKRGESRKEKTP